MRLIRAALLRFVGVFRRTRLDVDLSDELDGHLRAISTTVCGQG